jgi:hypothetical protein
LRRGCLRIIFKNLNTLWSIINAINAGAELADIIEAVGSKLSNLFDILAVSILLKEGLDLYIYCDESSGRLFIDEVARNTIKTFTFITGDRLKHEQVRTHLESRQFESRWRKASNARLKSHVSLPLINEGKVLGCVSINSGVTKPSMPKPFNFSP